MNSSLLLSSWGRGVMKKLMKGNNNKKKPVVDLGRRWNIITGDEVRVIEGPCKGQQGKVLAVIRRKDRVIVENVNLRRRNVKPTMDGKSGKIITRPCSIHYSNVMLIDPTTGEPTKISRRYLEDGTKVRVSKLTGAIIPKVDFSLKRKPYPILKGPKDTEFADVFEVTFADYEKYLPYIYDRVRREERTESDSEA